MPIGSGLMLVSLMESVLAEEDCTLVLPIYWLAMLTGMIKSKLSKVYFTLDCCIITDCI